MNRLGLSSIAVVLAGLSIAGASCGGDELSDAALPPKNTTTTSTTSAIPSTTIASKLYEVQPNDQLGNIAAAYHVSLEELMELNGIVNADRIQVGQILKIPPNTVQIADTLPSP